jgi:hypothetical protein
LPVPIVGQKGGADFGNVAAAVSEASFSACSTICRTSVAAMAKDHPRCYVLAMGTRASFDHADEHSPREALTAAIAGQAPKSTAAAAG